LLTVARFAAPLLGSTLCELRRASDRKSQREHLAILGNTATSERVGRSIVLFVGTAHLAKLRLVPDATGGREVLT
jgi:hypothetical protein